MTSYRRTYRAYRFKRAFNFSSLTLSILCSEVRRLGNVIKNTESKSRRNSSRLVFTNAAIWYFNLEVFHTNSLLVASLRQRFHCALRELWNSLGNAGSSESESSVVG